MPDDKNKGPKTFFDGSEKEDLSVFHPQLIFSLDGGDETYLDDDEPGLVVVRKVKNDRAILILPESIAHSFDARAPEPPKSGSRLRPRRSSKKL